MKAEGDIDATGPAAGETADGARATGAPATAASWGELERRHRVARIAWAAGAVVALAIAVGLAVALLGQRMSTGVPLDGGSVTGGVPSRTATSSGGVGASASGAASATSASSEPTGSQVATPTPPAVRAALVAYRFAGALWVCDESGGGAQRIAASRTGPFALSPDGRTIAVVDAASEHLLLIDVATRRELDAGPAEPERPAWASDSAAVAFTRQPAAAHDTVIVRVNRDGSGAATIGPGAVPFVAADGVVFAVSSSRTSGVPAVAYAHGSSKLLGRGIVADAVAATTSTVVYASAGSPMRGVPPSVGTMRRDGSAQRVLVGRPSTSEGAFFGVVEISPDARTIVYAETGDDGYSRIFAVPLAGGRSVRLSGRGDGYPLGFSVDGAELFYVDGNAVQGEPTRLMAVRLDGSHRRVVAEGAGM